MFFETNVDYRLVIRYNRVCQAVRHSNESKKMIVKNAKNVLKMTVKNIAPEGKLLSKKYNFDKEPLEYILNELLRGNNNEAFRKFHILKMYYDGTYINYGKGSNLIHKELCRDINIPQVKMFFEKFVEKVKG